MLDVINGEEIGFVEEGYRTNAKESLGEGEGLKEGTVARKAQFKLITRNAKRKQGYDEKDRVTVEIKDEQEHNHNNENNNNIIIIIIFHCHNLHCIFYIF